MGVLNGLRVVEVASSGASAFCGMFLADLGADVLVVEPLAGAAPAPRPEAICHRGKRSLALDLRHPAAREIALRLVDRADALVEGMPPGGMEGLGLGPDVCLSRKPSLAYGRITPWGQHGPLAQEAADADRIMAASGALWMASQPGEAPQCPQAMFAEVAGGAMFLAFGVLAAALRAQADGRGQVIDAAMADGCANLMNMMLGVVPARGGNVESIRANGYGRHWARSYRCADGEWIRIEPDEPQFYAELIRRLGLAHDGRFAAGQAHREAWPALAAQLDALFATKTRAQWCELLEGSDACFAPVLTPAEAARHPHNLARGIYHAIDGVLQAAPAPRFGATPSAPPDGVPARGSHTREVLAELGLHAHRIEELARAGAIG